MNLHWIFGDSTGYDMEDDRDGGRQRNRDMAQRARESQWADKMGKSRGPELRDPKEHGKGNGDKHNKSGGWLN